MRSFTLFAAACIMLLFACKKDSTIEGTVAVTKPFAATPYAITYPPFWMSNPMRIPADNPMTVEGVALGRKLFYDPILSKNGTMSCATCHNVANAFTDNGKQFSSGLHGELGKRNAMAIFNLGWFANYGPANHQYFWDGGAPDLESQALGPITNPIEMNEQLFQVVDKLKSSPEYPALFKKAFGTDSITSRLLAFAIAQFERTLISGNSKFDKGLLYGFNNVFTFEEAEGMQVFISQNRGDCFHCHSIASGFFTDFLFHNNGSNSADSGLAAITGNPTDYGKFKTASLRNLVFTAPYMHDGRFNTLEEVIDFYDSKAHLGTNADEFLTGHRPSGGLNLSKNDKKFLVAFLKTLSDSSFINNPQFAKP